MLYDAYEMQRSMLAGASALANFGAELLGNPANPFAYFGGGPVMASALEVFAHASAPRGKPEFGIDRTIIDGKQVDVLEQVVLRKPFGQLKRFARKGVEGGARLLIVAPMSGHYATLLRGTVEALLPEHDVHITDWIDAGSVPLSQGNFDLDDYVDYIIEFCRYLGPDVHVIAVCQPSVPVLAAASLMAQDNDPRQPRSLTLMGGPIDTRISPTVPNDLAMRNSMMWFRQNVISTVPFNYPGAMRRVYPGFLQLTSFISMNLDRHINAHLRQFEHLVKGDDDSAESHRAFYDEYLAVMDLTAEFYLQTVETVFVAHALPRGTMLHRGERVDLGAIRTCAILAVEGEKDDISGVGQTLAALDLTPNLPQARKAYHLQEGVGHYGVFNGSRFRSEIAPRIADFIATFSQKPSRAALANGHANGHGKGNGHAAADQRKPAKPKAPRASGKRAVAQKPA